MVIVVNLGLLVIKIKVCLAIYPGFVCFALILGPKSGEHLQDHWSSGLVLSHPIKSTVLSN